MNKGSFDACVVMQCIGRREAAAKIALAEEKHTAGGRQLLHRDPQRRIYRHAWETVG
jgi:hypothetical protein